MHQEMAALALLLKEEQGIEEESDDEDSDDQAG
jgi:hypothetical protein